MNWPRFLAAFLIAPATPGVVLVVPGLLAGGSGALAVFFFASVVAYAHAFVLGAPVGWLLARSKRRSLWRVVAVAFVVGALPFGGITLYQEATMPAGAGYTFDGVVLREDGHLTGAGLRFAVFGVLECGLLGAAAGLVWWWIAKPRPPHD